VPFKDITKTPQTSWFQRDDIKDNQDVRFGHIKGGVYWVRRVINSRVAQNMDVSIFPADRTAVWVNGEVVPRGDREKRSLPLKEGINTVFIRCDMPDQFQPFWMRYRDTCDVDMSIRASIRQNKNSDVALLAAYDKSDGNLRGLLQDQNSFLKYDRYATQRSEPRPTQFLAAFGQPKRETACACERQTNPTLLQALELLNGSETYQRLGNVSATYSALDDAAFVERIYLTAMSRMPVAKERDTALGFLTKAADKNKGRLDFVWALLSTKEFLFQH
jgi:sulfur carrier protein ThiS